MELLGHHVEGTLPERSQHCELEGKGTGAGDTEFPQCSQASCQLYLWALVPHEPKVPRLSCRGLSFFPSYVRVLADSTNRAERSTTGQGTAGQQKGERSQPRL